ncbi:hypothetical protein [Lancefieldella rimae]|nr:hypothetical protein [Lancefieldella rimae]
MVAIHRYGNGGDSSDILTAHREKDAVHREKDAAHADGFARSLPSF